MLMFRIRFGSNHLYIFRNPVEEAVLKKQHKLREFTYEDAQEEIVRNSGFDLTHGRRLEMLSNLQSYRD